MQIGRQGIHIVFQHLNSIASKPIAAEAANIILNVCYEKASVALVVQCRGVETLVSCLSDSNADLQANAAGAIQSICFQVGLWHKGFQLQLGSQQYTEMSLMHEHAAPSQESTCQLYQNLQNHVLHKESAVVWQGKYSKDQSDVAKPAKMGVSQCFRLTCQMAVLGARAEGSGRCWRCDSPYQLAGLCSCQSAQPCSGCPA